MFLHEEYLKRHSIDLNWVAYVRRAYAVYDCTNSPFRCPDLVPPGERYGLLRIERQNARNGPGLFVFARLKSYRTGILPEMDGTWSVEWNDYENALGELVKTILPIGKEKGFLLFWEMLLYSYDADFAKLCSKSDLFFSTVDPQNSNRLRAIDTFLSRFRHPRLNWWWDEVRNNYAGWLAEFSKPTCSMSEN
jgi:hypothetical protein